VAELRGVPVCYDDAGMFWLRFVLAVLRAMLFAAWRRLLGRRLHPAWSYRLEVVATVARWASARSAAAPVARVRAAMPGAPLPRRLARRVILSSAPLGGVATEWLTPRGWRPGDPCVLYLHGGGYVLCSPATHRELLARLAMGSGARVLAIDYRLAPEHPFPAALDDALAAYRGLLRSGVRAEGLLLGGDSAGGGLCLATMLELGRTGEPMPAGAVLLSPWVDLARTGATIRSSSSHDYISAELLEQYAGHYLQGADSRNPKASPLYARLAGLPPLLIHTGSAEALLWENLELASRARAAGVEVTHRVAEGMIHVWHGFARFLPEARQAIGELAEFVRAHAARG
jgi:monoterpene epsilon-lactone hydrolase